MPDPNTLASEPHTVPAEPVAAAGWELRPVRCADALPAGARVNEFEILDVLGEGGFGIVYRARDHSLQRTIALKEYMPVVLAGRSATGRVSVKSGEHVQTFLAGLRSFVNEAQLLARFDHPSLVKVHRFCEANGTAYMAMPIYEGGTLKQVLRERTARGQVADENWLRALLDPLLDALAILHAENCLHRDVSPDNIILVGGDLPEPRPVLLDFGAARRVIREQTQALTVILKPGYAPLEQYDEIPGMKQGPWTDLYALAAVLHFAMTGEPPPQSVRRAMLDVYQPLTGAGARLPTRYTKRFLTAIDRALAPLPGDRPRDVAAWRSMLTEATEPQPHAGRAALASSAVPARPRASPSPRRTGRGRLAIAGLVLVAGTTLFVGVPRLLPHHSEPADATRAPGPDSAASAPLAPVDAGPPVLSRSVDSRPLDSPHRPPPRLGAQALGDAPDPGPRFRESAHARGAEPPDEEEHIASAPASVRESLREARRCLVARRYACTIELAEAVLKKEPGQPVALRLARQGREGLAGGGWKRR